MRNFSLRVNNVMQREEQAEITQFCCQQGFYVRRDYVLKKPLLFARPECVKFTGIELERAVLDENYNQCNQYIQSVFGLKDAPTHKQKTYLKGVRL